MKKVPGGLCDVDAVFDGTAGGAPCVTVGDMFKNDLNPTLEEDGEECETTVHGVRLAIDSPSK